MTAARRICVYCASSPACDREYLQAAFRIGEILAEQQFTMVYGGGKVGLMGELASGALSKSGTIVGIIPKFMVELEWAHDGLSQLQLVDDMRSRKHLMLEGSAGVVALPGGSGTLEELLEAITLKRLGIYFNPIVIVNTRGYFDPLLEMFTRAVDERFMNPQHLKMWQVVREPEEVPEALTNAIAWSAAARNFAAVKLPAESE